MVILIDNFCGKSEKTGNEFRRVTLMEVSKKKDNTFFTRTESYFLEDVTRCSTLKVGDLVKVEFEPIGVISPKLKLVDLKYDGANVFAKYM